MCTNTLPPSVTERDWALLLPCCSSTEVTHQQKHPMMFVSKCEPQRYRTAVCIPTCKTESYSALNNVSITFSNQLLCMLDTKAHLFPPNCLLQSSNTLLHSLVIGFTAGQSGQSPDAVTFQENNRLQIHGNKLLCLSITLAQDKQDQSSNTAQSGLAIV